MSKTELNLQFFNWESYLVLSSFIIQWTLLSFLDINFKKERSMAVNHVKYVTI